MSQESEIYKTIKQNITAYMRDGHLTLKFKNNESSQSIMKALNNLQNRNCLTYSKSFGGAMIELTRNGLQRIKEHSSWY